MNRLIDSLFENVCAMLFIKNNLFLLKRNLITLIYYKYYQIIKILYKD